MKEFELFVVGVARGDEPPEGAVFLWSKSITPQLFNSLCFQYSGFLCRFITARITTSQPSML